MLYIAMCHNSLMLCFATMIIIVNTTSNNTIGIGYCVNVSSCIMQNCILSTMAIAIANFKATKQLHVH